MVSELRVDVLELMKSLAAVSSGLFELKIEVRTEARIHASGFISGVMGKY